MLAKLLVYFAMLAGVLAFIGVFIVLFDNSRELYCVRPAGQNPACKVSTSLLGKFTTSTQAVSDVVEVQQEKSCDPDCSYRATLVSASGERLPINDVYTDQEPVMQQITEMRAFLGSSDPSFSYKQDAASWELALTGGLGLLGVGLVTLNFVRSLLDR